MLVVTFSIMCDMEWKERNEALQESTVKNGLRLRLHYLGNTEGFVWCILLVGLRLYAFSVHDSKDILLGAYKSKPYILMNYIIRVPISSTLIF